MEAFGRPFSTERPSDPSSTSGAGKRSFELGRPARQDQSDSESGAAEGPSPEHEPARDALHDRSRRAERADEAEPTGMHGNASQPPIVPTGLQVGDAGLDEAPRVPGTLDAALASLAHGTPTPPVTRDAARAPAGDLIQQTPVVGESVARATPPALGSLEAALSPAFEAASSAPVEPPLTGFAVDPAAGPPARPAQPTESVAAPDVLAPARVSAEALERAGEVLRQVRVQITPELREATIHLRPPELGRIAVRVSFEEGGRVHAVVRAEHPETLDLLARHLPELRAAFEQRGIAADEIDLSLGLDDGDQHENGEGPTQDHARRTSDASTSEAQAPPPELIRAIGPSGVDVYA